MKKLRKTSASAMALLACAATCMLAIESHAQGLVKQKPSVLDAPVAQIEKISMKPAYDTDGAKISVIEACTSQHGKEFSGTMVVYIYAEGKGGKKYYGLFEQGQSVKTTPRNNKKLAAHTSWQIRIKPKTQPEEITIKEYVLEYYDKDHGNKTLLATKLRAQDDKSPWKDALIKGDIPNELDFKWSQSG